jgi:hypothetical protein
MSTPTTGAEAVRESVRAKYAEHALRVTNVSGTCCATSCCGAPEGWDGSAFDRFEAGGGRLVSAFVRAQKP